MDYRPLNWGPKFLLCDQPTYLHTRLGDCYNKHYSGFLYLPESFRMSTNHLQTIDLTTWTTCTDHASKNSTEGIVLYCRSVYSL